MKMVMIRLPFSPRYGPQSTPFLAAAAFITLAVVYLLRYDSRLAPLSSYSAYSFSPSSLNNFRTTAAASGFTLDVINKTAQYFVDYPLKPPYNKIFSELGERTKILRSWIEALERREIEKETLNKGHGGGGGGGGGQLLGAHERDFLAMQVERVVTSLYPYLQSPPRDPHSQSPFADLRRSFQSADTRVREVDGKPPSNAGIIIPTGSRTLRFACHLLASLTRVHRTTLPIQIVYAGEDDLSQQDRDALIQAASVTGEGSGDDEAEKEGKKTKKERTAHIEFLDILTVFNDTTLRLAEGGWAIKPFAALGSRFDEVILLDADVVLMQAPEKLLRQRSYREKGALLFHDRLLWKGQFPDRLEWYHEMIKHPSDEMRQSLVWTQGYAEEGDSGVVVLDKRRVDVLLGLLHTAWQNTYEVRNAWSYRIAYGDKETWWIGLEVTGSTYAFSRHYGGMVGWRYPIQGQMQLGEGMMAVDDGADVTQVCSFVIAHVDEADALLWYNGGLLKNKMGNATEFAVPTHWMMDQQWVKGAKKKDMSCMVGTKARELTEREKNVLASSIEAAQLVDFLLELV